MQLQKTYQSNNIYVPGLARPGQLRPDQSPEDHDAASGPLGQYAYSDDEVKELPAMAASHPHYREWLWRQKVCKKLILYLATQKQAPGILEVGCGNGWLSAQLSTVPGSRVVGIDRDLPTLQQAARVFHHEPNLKFIYGDFCSDILHDLAFDVIVFANSIQYFPSLRGIIETTLDHLRPEGEIHILDTCFAAPENPYARNSPNPALRPDPPDQPDTALNAVTPTYAFHHCIHDLKPFRYRYFYDPRSIWNKLFGNGNPCPWICISSSHQI